MRGLKLYAAAAALAVVLVGSPNLWAAEVSEDDPLVRSAHQAIAGPLNTALEHERSNHPVPWGDPMANLNGVITVFPPVIQAGRPCRSFKYEVRNGQDEVVDKGLYCRDPTGLWRTAGVPDLLDKHPIDPVVPYADKAGSTPSQSESTLARLQKNLVRLAYGVLPTDGSSNTDFITALMQFEADEGIQQGTDPDAIRRALERSTATLARSNTGGVCEAPNSNDGATLMCGRRR